MTCIFLSTNLGKGRLGAITQKSMNVFLKYLIIINLCITFSACTSDNKNRVKSPLINEPTYASAQILKSEKITGVLGNDKSWSNITTHVRYITGGKFPVEAEAEFAIDPSTGVINDK